MASAMKKSDPETVFYENATIDGASDMLSIKFSNKDNSLDLSLKLQTFSDYMMPILILNWLKFYSDKDKIEGMDFTNVRVIQFKFDVRVLDMSASALESNDDWKLLEKILPTIPKVTSHVLFDVEGWLNFRQIKIYQQTGALMEKLVVLLKDKAISVMGVINGGPMKPFDLKESFSMVNVLFVADSGSELLASSTYENQIKELILYHCKYLEQKDIEDLLKKNAVGLEFQLFTKEKDTFWLTYASSVEWANDFQQFQIIYGAEVMYERDCNLAKMEVTNAEKMYDLVFSKERMIVINELDLLQFTYLDDCDTLSEFLNAFQGTLSLLELNVDSDSTMGQVFDSISPMIVQKHTALPAQNESNTNADHDTHHDASGSKAEVDKEPKSSNLTIIIKCNGFHSITMSETVIDLNVGLLSTPAIYNIVNIVSRAETMLVLKIKDENKQIFCILRDQMKKEKKFLNIKELVVYEELKDINFSVLFAEDSSLERFSFIRDRKIQSVLGGQSAECKYHEVQSPEAMENLIVCMRKPIIVASDNFFWRLFARMSGEQ